MNQSASMKTLSVGIPAYNEEANIGYLIRDILHQAEEDYILEKIYVYSDGSTDRTNEIVRSFQNEKIELIVGPGRQGQAVGQNHIVDICESDCLILINADMQVADYRAFTFLAKPILEGIADLTSSNLQPLPPRTFLEGVLSLSARLKSILFEQYQDGHNLYTCRGAARALSRRFYTSMRFPKSVGEDAYSYLACVSQGFTYRYAKEAIVYYRLPAILADHRKQSTRFFNGTSNFVNEFGVTFVAQHMRIPLSVILKGFWRALPEILRHPIRVTCYLGILLLMRIESFFVKQASDTWMIAESSKQLR
jgi:glycosyltransferase involved in cell wall biosynthesis